MRDSGCAIQVVLRMLVGSALDARSAGSTLASVAMTARVETAAAIVVRSYGVTPKMRERRTPTLLSASSAPAAGDDAAASAATPAETSPTDNAPAATSSGGWAVQVASFTSDADAQALRGRLQQLGYTGYVQSVATANGTNRRVCAGPVVSRDAAERLRAAISDSLHIGGMLVVRK